MARDATLEQRIETTLYTAGVHNSGDIASAIIDGVKEHLHELLDNAVSNRVDDGYAPWLWVHELRDQINMLGGDDATDE